MYEFSRGIWLHEGDTVSWFGMPYSTRMTIIPLEGDRLWVHSPCKISPQLLSDIQELGSPCWLVAPNKIHHLYLAEWRDAFPDAKLFAAPGLAEKRTDLDFDAQLGHEPDTAWAGDIDQLIFGGSRVMEEVVFFHRESSTVIVTDLIENFSPDHFQGLHKQLAKLTGIISAHP